MFVYKLFLCKWDCATKFRFIGFKQKNKKQEMLKQETRNAKTKTNRWTRRHLYF